MRAFHELDVDAPPGRLMALLTRFEDYPSFIEELRSAQVLSREEQSWEVAFVASVIRELPYTLRLTQLGPDEDGALELRWSLVEGAFRSNSGRWRLQPLDGGARCHVLYEVDLAVGVHVPTTITNTLLRRSLPQMLEAFKTRAESPPPLPAS